MSRCHQVVVLALTRQRAHPGNYPTDSTFFRCELTIFVKVSLFTFVHSGPTKSLTVSHAPSPHCSVSKVLYTLEIETSPIETSLHISYMVSISSMVIKLMVGVV